MFACLGAFSGRRGDESQAEAASTLKLLWIGAGSGEGERAARAKSTVEALRKNGVNAVWSEAPRTTHEWQTWRQCPFHFAPLLFR